MSVLFFLSAAFGVSGGPSLEPLQIPEEAKPAVAEFEKCLVDQALTFEPAKEAVAETVRIAKLACVEQQDATTRALLGKHYPLKGAADADFEPAVDSVIRTYSTAEEKAELAVIRQRARKSK